MRNWALKFCVSQYVSESNIPLIISLINPDVRMFGISNLSNFIFLKEKCKECDCNREN